MGESLDGVEKIILRGVLIDNTVNENSWQILAEDLPDIAAQSVGIQLRLDHSEEVSKVKGKILFAEMDKPHDFEKNDWDPAIDVPHIHFEAELVTNDQSILIPVMQGYVDHVSINADAEHIYCSECGKPTRPFKRCNCVSHDILHGIKVKEYSIVTNPTYKNASFVPFTAAVSKHLKELEGDKLETPQKSEINITSGVTNIYNNNDKTEVITEIIPKVETEITDAKIEDVVEVKASSEKISVTADTELQTVEAGIKEEIVAENSEKIPNVNQDIQKGPGVNKLESMEVEKMPEDVKEKEVSAHATEGPVYEAEDISGLISAVKELVALLTQMKTEASEEEDEETKVQANDGNVTEDHDQKSGNPPKGDGPVPKPPKSYAEPEAPKTDVLPVKTPAMSASKGISAGLVGAVGKQLDNEQASLEEVIKFAAMRGIVPRK